MPRGRAVHSVEVRVRCLRGWRRRAGWFKGDGGAMKRTRRLTMGSVAVLLGAGLSVVGCGSDDGATAAAGKSTTSAVSSTAAPTTTGASTGFCNSWRAVEEVTSQGPEGADDGPPSAAALSAFATQIKAKLDPAASAAPEAVAQEIGDLKTIVDGVASGGDGSVLDPSNPKLGTPLSAVEAWTYDNCGWQQMPVDAVDYAFKGLPSSLKAGTSIIRLSNSSNTEAHMIALLRVNDTAKVTVDELMAALESDPTAAEAKYGSDTTQMNGAFAEPGKVGYAVVDLKPGTYVGACFIPIGGTDGAPLHTTKGMVTSFVVT